MDTQERFMSQLTWRHPANTLSTNFLFIWKRAMVLIRGKSMMQQTKSWGRVSTPRVLGYTLLGNYIVNKKKGNISTSTWAVPTCRCQNRNVNMSPIPKPMNHETNRKEPHLTFAKYLSTVTHSGISRVVWANICVCENNKSKLINNRIAGKTIHEN